MRDLFNNTANAFSLKTNAELRRAYLLFNLIKNKALVSIGNKLTQLALKIHLPIESLIKYFIFDHFCGGVSIEDCKPVIDKMFDKGVSSILDYSVEGKEEDAYFDDAMQKTIRIANYQEQRHALPFVVFKPTGLGRLALYEKVGLKKTLTAQENTEWNKIVARFEQVCTQAKQCGVKVLIDAEETWMQDAVDDLVEQLMERYNTEYALIYNTLQMYRIDRWDYLKKMHQRAQDRNYFIGIKLVRGAYLEKENERAAQQHYPSPICKTKADSDRNFNKAAAYIMGHLNRIAFFIGSHNEESVYKILDMMDDKKIKKNDPRICFSQLYGMSDHITFNLAKQGYVVAKYLPFGPVREVMPYLIRRAQENTSVANQTLRELNLIKEERRRRRQLGETCSNKK